MVILAQADTHNEYIVPIPFNSSQEKTGDEPIIVFVSDNPPDPKMVSSVYAYYGKENCQVIIGKMPSKKQEQFIICIPSHCVIEKACSLNSLPPPHNISPLWTEDRFGMSPSEAVTLKHTSKNMLSQVSSTMEKYRKKLKELKIKIDKKTIDNIQECEVAIDILKQNLEETKEKTRIHCAKCVARFMKTKYDVDAWVDLHMEPTVLFCVNKKADNDETTVIGSAIEGVMNEVEPGDAERFFNEYVYDASVFPIVMDVSFVEGKRIKSKKEYYEISGGIS